MLGTPAAGAVVWEVSFGSLGSTGLGISGLGSVLAFRPKDNPADIRTTTARKYTIKGLPVIDFLNYSN
jgi:hypothetical protein